MRTANLGVNRNGLCVWGIFALNAPPPPPEECGKPVYLFPVHRTTTFVSTWPGVVQHSDSSFSLDRRPSTRNLEPLQGQEHPTGRDRAECLHHL